MKKKIIIGTIIICIIVLSAILIINPFKDNSKKINYIALGDSIAEGMNEKYLIGYGYTDYIRDYLDEKDVLGFYTKGFAHSGYRTYNLKRDLENNVEIEEDGEKLTIIDALKDADLVTLTIGANDFIELFSLNNIDERINDIESLKDEVDDISIKVKDIIVMVQKYAKKQIIVTGYFNPLPYLTKYKEQTDELVKYFSEVMGNICKELGIIYVDIFDIFDGNTDLLPNPANIHPTKEAYKLIGERITKFINIDK